MAPLHFNINWEWARSIVHGQVGEGGEGARRWFMGRLGSDSTTEPFRSGLQSLSVIGQIVVSVVR